MPPLYFSSFPRRRGCGTDDSASDLTELYLQIVLKKAPHNADRIVLLGTLGGDSNPAALLDAQADEETVMSVPRNAFACIASRPARRVCSPPLLVTV